MNFKDVVETTKNIVEILFAFPAAWLAYTRWIKPARIGAGLDFVMLAGPRKAGEVDDTPNTMSVVAQLRVYNAGAKPESMPQIEAFELILSQGAQQWLRDVFHRR
jgi:hypothetical protein